MYDIETELSSKQYNSIDLMKLIMALVVHKAVAREVLADGDISQHVAAPPFFASTRGSTRLSPASRRFLASKIILTA